MVVLLPDGLVVGGWVTIGDLQFKHGGGEAVPGPARLVTDRQGKEAHILAFSEVANGVIQHAVEVEGVPARAADVLPRQILLYVSDPATPGMEVVAGGLVCGSGNVPVWAPDPGAFVVLPDTSSLMPEYVYSGSPEVSMP